MTTIGLGNRLKIENDSYPKVKVFIMWEDCSAIVVGRSHHLHLVSWIFTFQDPVSPLLPFPIVEAHY
jgi:hypothetical protein